MKVSRSHRAAKIGTRAYARAVGVTNVSIQHFYAFRLVRAPPTSADPLPRYQGVNP
jgi:hypothetical protein